VIELSNPEAKVDVKVNGREIILPPDGKRVRIRAGANQTLEVSGPDYEPVRKSFDLMRGGVATVQVPLQPKAGLAKVTDPKNPREPSKNLSVVVESPRKDPPKAVSYPEKSMLIEIPGWQILANATKDEMQNWLDERKRARHSVTWLDAFPVTDKPAFAAVAALDERQPKWKAVLELPATAMNPGGALYKIIDLNTEGVASVSGYVKDAEPHFSLLSQDERMIGWVSPDDRPEVMEQTIEKETKDGRVPRLLRPFSIGQSNPRIAYATEQALGEKPSFIWKASADDLEAFVRRVGAQGYRVSSIAAYTREDNLEFAAVSRPNREKWEWQTATNLTPVELKAKVVALADKGFRPASVTGHAYDGAVRYCVVWVKEPPQPK
jgi:hypothetical protein